MELETALETVLDSKAFTPQEKIEGIADLVKDKKGDEFASIIRTLLVSGKTVTPENRIKEIRNYMEERAGKLATERQYDVTMKKLKLETSRAPGSYRPRVDDPWDRPPREMEDCRCWGIDLACLIPRRIKPQVVEGLRWIAFIFVGILIIRWFWTYSGRVFR